MMSEPEAAMGLLFVYIGGVQVFFFIGGKKAVVG